MIRLAALFALTATAASAGGLAPPIVAFSFATPQAVVARCPVVPAALESLRGQGFTRIVAEPGARVARFSALRNGQWSVLGYDCHTGVPLFQEAVAVANTDLVDEGVYILEGSDVDTVTAAGTSLDATAGGNLDTVTDVDATAAVSLGAEATFSPSTPPVALNEGVDVLGNGRSLDPTTLQRIDAVDATAGGAVTDSGF